MLFELAAALARSGHSGLFRESLANVGLCVSAYLSARRRFTSHEDAFLNDVVSNISDLTSIARATQQEALLVMIWRLERDIAIEAAKLETIGVSQGYCYLPSVIKSELLTAMDVEMLSGRYESTFQGIRALGGYGRIIAGLGCFESAVTLIGDLFQLASRASLLKRHELVLIAKREMAEVAFFAVAASRPNVSFDLVGSALVESYGKAFDLTRADPFINSDDPFATWSPDLTKDRSPSALVRVALFPLAPTDPSISENLEFVKSLIELMKLNFVQQRGVASLDHQLYQSALWLIAFTDTGLTLDLLVIYPEATIPSARNLRSGEAILLDLIRWHIRTYVASCKKDDRTVGHGRDLQTTLLSLLAMILTSEDWRGRNGEARVESLVLSETDEIRGMLDLYSLDGTGYRNLERFASFLARERLCPKARRRIMALLRKAGHPGQGYSPGLFEFVYIKRPIITFNPSVFERLDARVFAGR